ncbi:MAG: hypothetical protein AAGG99_03450 [Pseudomonadota bacterium]
MDKPWEEIDHDPVSGRRIFMRETSFGTGGYGGHDFEISADFEVRDATGRVLLTTCGSAKGEYWCGTRLMFVEGTNGQRVALYESHRTATTSLDVPDGPVSSV